MKTLFLAVLALFGSAVGFADSQSVATGWWPVQAQVWISPAQSTVVVQNYWGYPVICQGRVSGLTYSGMSRWLNVFIGPIIPGTYGYAYVSAWAGDPFVSAQASIYCRWY